MACSKVHQEQPVPFRQLGPWVLREAFRLQSSSRQVQACRRDTGRQTVRDKSLETVPRQVRPRAQRHLLLPLHACQEPVRHGWSWWRRTKNSHTTCASSWCKCRWTTTTWASLFKGYSVSTSWSPTALVHFVSSRCVGNLTSL